MSGRGLIVVRARNGKVDKDNQSIESRSTKRVTVCKGAVYEKGLFTKIDLACTALRTSKHESEQRKNKRVKRKDAVHKTRREEIRSRDKSAGKRKPPPPITTPLRHYHILTFPFPHRLSFPHFAGQDSLIPYALLHRPASSHSTVTA